MAKAPVWLNEEEQATWRVFLAAHSMLDESLDRQLQRNAGLPHAYYMILAMLSEAEDQRLRMQDLAAIVQASQSRLSHAVSRLAEAGWVEREKATNDRRGIFVQLTKSGMNKVSETAPGHVGEVRSRLFDALSAEQVTQLRGICEAIVSHADWDVKAQSLPPMNNGR